MHNHRTKEVGLIPIITLVIWLCCLAVGLVGLLLPGHPALPPATQPIVPATEILNVDITPDSVQQDIGLPSDNAAQTASDQSSVPAAPALPTVAAPSAAIAFALPIEGTVHIVSQQLASPARSAPVTPAKVQHLTFGVGQGIQPAPDYPHEAVVAHQQGQVVVRLTVAADGSVTDANAVLPCPWPLLNQSAVRTVRERWHFTNLAPGPYDVSIEFELNQ